MRSIFRRSLTIRTLLVGGVLAALLGAAFAVLVVAVREQQAAGRLALRSQQAIGAGSALETSLVNLENGVRGYVASGRERLLEPFRTARRTYPAQAERLSRLVADEPRQQAAVRQITTGINDYVALWALPLVGLADDRREVAQSVLATGTGRERLDTLRSELATLFARERSVAADRERRADKRSDTAVILGLIGMGLVALVALGMWLALRRSILRPVERVALATRAVADGDLTVHVPADREDEIGTLARSFNDMTDALNRSHQQLDTRTRDLERSNHDLEQYAQMASHDLQAPLATIDLYLRLIERRLPDASQEELLQLLEGVGGSTDRMRSLVRDLLHLARVGRGEPRRETLDTRAVLDRALENLAGPIEERGADVSAGPLPDRQRRSGPAEPAVPEPPGQRDQVQRPRRAARERHGVDRGRGGAVRRARQRHRDRPAARGADLPAVPATARRGPLRGNRDRPGDLPAHRQPPRRADLGREHRGRRQHVPLHAAAGGREPAAARADDHARARDLARSGRMRARLATLLALGALGILLALAGCGGGGDDPADGPSQSQDPIRLGTKNFTEQYILGEIYAQSLRAHGIPVELKSDIGSSEIVDQAMQIGSLDMYPEYTGVLLSEIAGVSERPPSAEATFAAAQKFERTRGYDLLKMTPFSNSNALAVTHKTAMKYGLRTIGDLAKVPGGATIAAPPEFRTRFEGLVGLRDRYMLRAKVVAMPIGQQYRALDQGRVDAAAVFATDGMLEDEEYTILRDPRNLFSFQNVTPVVRTSVLKRTPELTKAVDPVSAKLTTDAMRQMNAQVDIDGMEPAEVAKQFLEREGLL